MTNVNGNDPPPMDPQLKSILTSVAMSLSMAVAGWAVTKGIIPGGDQSVLANQMVLVGSGVVTFLIGWYKTRMVTQKAMIKAVNTADNGVKVVDASTPAPAVSEPVKGTK